MSMALLSHKISVPAEAIKVFALLAMTLDHFSKIFGVGQILDDTIGRTAFPIFGFLLIQNLHQYHPARKYIVRLTVFGVFTSLILHLYTDQVNNILLTFLWAVIFIQAAEFLDARLTSLVWKGYWLLLLMLLMMSGIIATDYSFPGFCLLITLYGWFSRPSRLNTLNVLIFGALCNFYAVLPVLITVLTLLTLMYVIRVDRGSRVIKWWGFYLYYPLHQVALYILKYFCPL